MIGPRIVPMPNTAMACPWRSGGLICSKIACDSGTSPAPPTPCKARKNTSSPRLVAAPHSAEGEADDRDQKDMFDAESTGEPAAQRHHDRGADDIGGQRPGDLVLRGRQASLDVRQSDIEDRVVDTLHDVRQHDRKA